MAPFFGNSVACRIAEAHEIRHSTLVLGDWRAAQRIEFYIGREPPAAAEGAGRDVQAAAALLGEGELAGRRRRGLRTRSGASGGSSSGGSSDADAAVLQRAGSSGSEASVGERSVLTGGAGGFKVWVVNTHLDHEHPDNRQRQVGPAGRAAWWEHAFFVLAAVCVESWSFRPGGVPVRRRSLGHPPVPALICHLGHLPCCVFFSRAPQALAVCEWMAAEQADCAAVILCGDFNGGPGEPFHSELRRRGYVSAHATRHGREPRVRGCRRLRATAVLRTAVLCLLPGHPSHGAHLRASLCSSQVWHPGLQAVICCT